MKLQGHSGETNIDQIGDCLVLLGGTMELVWVVG